MVRKSNLLAEREDWSTGAVDQSSTIMKAEKGTFDLKHEISIDVGDCKSTLLDRQRLLGDDQIHRVGCLELRAHHRHGVSQRLSARSSRRHRHSIRRHRVDRITICFRSVWIVNLWSTIYLSVGCLESWWYIIMWARGNLLMCLNMKEGKSKRAVGGRLGLSWGPTACPSHHSTFEKNLKMIWMLWARRVSVRPIFDSLVGASGCDRAGPSNRTRSDATQGL